DARRGRLPLHLAARASPIHERQPLQPAIQPDRGPLADARSQRRRAPARRRPTPCARAGWTRPPAQPAPWAVGGRRAFAAPRPRSVVALPRLRRSGRARAARRSARARGARRRRGGATAAGLRRRARSAVKRLAVVLLNWNGRRDTLAALDTL